MGAGKRRNRNMTRDGSGNGNDLGRTDSAQDNTIPTLRHVGLQVVPDAPDAVNLKVLALLNRPALAEKARIQDFIATGNFLAVLACAHLRHRDHV